LIRPQDFRNEDPVWASNADRGIHLLDGEATEDLDGLAMKADVKERLTWVLAF